VVAVAQQRFFQPLKSRLKMPFMSKYQNSDPRRWYQGDKGQSRWIEVWWIITGKWSLNRIWGDGIQHGIRMEYHERVLRPGVLALSASNEERENSKIPTEKVARIARVPDQELVEGAAKLSLKYDAVSNNGLIEVARSP
jgi:hypothetical protein